MKDKTRLSFSDFKEITIKVCSDMFLCVFFITKKDKVFLYLRSNLQIYEKVYLYAKKIKKMNQVSSPSMTHTISSPRVLSHFSPVASIIRRNSVSGARAAYAGSEENKDSSGNSRSRTKSQFKKSTKDGTSSRFNSLSNKLDGFSQFCSEAVEDSKQLETGTKEEDFTNAMGEETAHEDFHAHKLPTLKVNSNDLNWLREQKPSSKDPIIPSPTQLSGDVVRISTHTTKVSKFYVAPVVVKEPGVEDSEEASLSGSDSSSSIPSLTVMYCECGNACESENTLCKACMQKQQPIEYSGPLYIHLYSSVKLCWIRLLNRELYCYNSKDDPDYFKMYQLNGVFVREEQSSTQKIEGNPAYCFSLHIQKNKKFFYTKTKAEQDSWITVIRHAIGYSSFFSFYIVKVFFNAI